MIGSLESEGDQAQRGALLADLRAPDQLSLIFNPIGLGSPLSPEGAAEHQAQMIERARLVEAVPGGLRENFERARKLHLHGILEYEFFTAASDYALLVLEGALRLRFLSYYEHKIPVFRGAQAEVVEATDFEPVLRAKGDIRLRRGQRKEALPRYLKALLEWARAERLLPGRRTRIVDGALAELRNHAAHPIERTIGDPVESARMLRDVAEYINCLWGVRAEDGRLFGGPLRRRARVAAVYPDDSAAKMELFHVSGLPAQERGGRFAVFLATDAEELIIPFQGFAYQEGFQATQYPCERLWMGTWSELVSKVDVGEFADVGDRVEHRDRLFLLRVGEAGPDLPRSAQDLLALADPPKGAWIAIVADDPYEAFAHARDHEPGDGMTCRQCYVDVTGRFDSTDAAVGFARTPAESIPDMA